LNFKLIKWFALRKLFHTILKIVYLKNFAINLM